VNKLDREEIFTKVKAIIVEYLGVDEDKVTLEANYLEDLIGPSPEPPEDQILQAREDLIQSRPDLAGASEKLLDWWRLDFRKHLDADSLDLVELIIEFEKEFGGEIEEDDAREITTVGQAVDYLVEQLGK
jgi:acyl carrier protein